MTLLPKNLVYAVYIYVGKRNQSYFDSSPDEADNLLKLGAF